MKFASVNNSDIFSPVTDILYYILRTEGRYSIIFNSALTADIRYQLLLE